MRWLLLLALPLCAQPTISNVRNDYITAPDGSVPHSSRRIVADISAQACYFRIQFGKTISYGDQTATLYTCPANSLGTPQINDLGQTLSGLQAGQTYYFCVQASFDGSTWNTCTGAAIGSFTLPALPSPHPQAPMISGLWNPVFPSTVSCATYAVSNDCTTNSLQAGFAAAVARQPSQCTVITIPDEALQTNACPALQGIDDTQFLTIPQDSSHVNTSTGVFTYTNSVSGWTVSNGQVVRVATDGCLPDTATHGNGNNSLNLGTQDACGTGGVNGTPMNGHFTTGINYYIVGASGSTFQLSLTSGGSPIIPGDTGSPSATMRVGQWPPMNSNWIIIQTSTPDATFCPQGVRCMGSIWSSKMAKIAVTGGAQFTNPISTGFFSHNIWFRGIDLTSTDASALAASTVDPQSTNYFFVDPYSNSTSYIVFDRSYLHCQAFPNRCSSFFYTFGGSYKAIIDSDLENWNYYRPWNSPGEHAAIPGFQGNLSGNTLTLNAGISYEGFINTCTATSNITFTFTGGSTSGSAFVWMGPDCTPTLVAPLTTTGTCTGSATDKNSVSHSCLFTTNASPYWKLDSNSAYNCVTLGDMSVSGSGVPSNYNDSSPYPASLWNSEGTQGINAGWGPGPMSYLRNFWEGSGLLIHFDDSSPVDPADVWIRQNSFAYNPIHQTGSATSNNLRYANRNGPEFKHGRSIKVDGNICSNNWADVSLTGPCFLAHTAANNGTVGTAGGIGAASFTIQDYDFTNNSCINTATCVQAGNGIQNLTPFPVAARIRIKNNFFNTNGFTQVDQNINAFGGQSAGNAIELDSAIEDLIIDHNTLYDLRGSNPAMFHSAVTWIEGCQVTNNFWWFNLINYGITLEYPQNQYGSAYSNPQITGTGSAMFNSYCTSDPNTPSGVMAGNVGVPYYSTFGATPPFAPSGIVAASSITSNFGSLLPNVMTGSTAPANLNAILFTNAAQQNFKLIYNSPYVSGAQQTTDGTDVGVDWNALWTAQGAVGTPTVLSIGTTTATISWFAYDGSVACSVDYATAPNDPNTQTGGGRATASAVNSQSVSLTGLSANTAYSYRVLCPVNQPTGNFQTQ